MLYAYIFIVYNLYMHNTYANLLYLFSASATTVEYAVPIWNFPLGQYIGVVT